VLRRAGERIAFATRRLKFEFQMLMDLHEQMKVNNAMREGVAKAEAEAAEAAASAEAGQNAETAETETTDSSPELTPSTSSSEESVSYPSLLIISECRSGLRAVDCWEWCLLTCSL
jgi:hypothetical protein